MSDPSPFTVEGTATAHINLDTGEVELSTGWMHVGADGQLTEVTIEELFGLGQLVNATITAEETVLAPAPADRIYRNAQGWWYRRNGVPHGPHLNLIEAVADRTQYRYDLAQRQAD